MAHEIFGQRFLSYRQPAWHGLGMVLEEQVGAMEAYKRIGAYDVGLFPVQVKVGEQVIPAVGYQAIVRTPTDDDPSWSIFGVVSDGYTLISPWEAVEIWDHYVGVPVETIGCLKGGSVLFITAKLPSWSVRGDEVDDYLLLHNPMTGWGAAQVAQTQVRVVCNNTLRTALQQSGATTYTVVHGPGASERLGTWMRGMYQNAASRARALQEAYDILAGYRLKKSEIQSVIISAYPVPGRPRDDCPPEIFSLRMDAWEASRRIIEGRRVAAAELFAGDGLGSGTPAAQGTAWGLYNAICEVEDYRRWVRLNSKSYDALYGERAATKMRAFEACMALAKN
ncbi:MAG: DUF932 domain-containing protein [Chloroflexota bacterium]